MELIRPFFLSFFFLLLFFYIRRLIKSSSLHLFTTVFTSFFQRMKKIFYTIFLYIFFSFFVSSLFGTQHQLTHTPVKNWHLPLRKMPVFQGVSPRHKIFTSSCVIPPWDSATADSPSDKKLNPSTHEDACFSGRCTSACKFYFILCHPSLGLRSSSFTLR